MPTYEYRCGKCGHRFEAVLTVGAHDSFKARCPKCRSTKVERVFSSFFAKTSRKS